MTAPLRIALLTAALTGGMAPADTLSLTGTIRDFSDSHPDFEGTIGGLEPGAVKGTLFGGKPKLSAQGKASSQFTTQGRFSQWYRDVPGINQSTPYTIDLTDPDGDGLYSYSSNAFFPINDQLIGNEGRSQNYHFTYEIAGQMSFAADDSFTFEGDDDMWVFVGDKLALDLGGVHGKATSSFTGSDLIGLGLNPGENHDFNIFFAERHTTQSNFAITTSLAISTPPPVPLPASFPLLFAGAGVFGWLRWRRRRLLRLNGVSGAT